MQKDVYIYKCYACKGEFHTVSRTLKDGVNCPNCSGKLDPDRVVPKYDKNEVITHARYECLSCGYADTLRGKRKDYKEIQLCPKCNGLFIDSWHRSKYEHLKNRETHNINLVELEIQKQLLSILGTDFKNWNVQIDAIIKVAQVYSMIKN